MTVLAITKIGRVHTEDGATQIACILSAEGAISPAVGDNLKLLAPPPPPERCPLTPPELECLRALAEGKVYKEIALDRRRSISTIRTQLHSVYNKLGVRDRAQAVLLAASKGWL